MTKKEYNKLYYSLHKEHNKMLAVKWRKLHPEQAKRISKKYNDSHFKERKQYYDAHREHYRNYEKSRWNKYKLLVWGYYSNGSIKCNCCGETMLEFLALDHIDNNGNEERKRLGNIKGTAFYKYLVDNGYPKGYQVLCFNCNWGKAHTLDHICPHKRSST